MPKSAWTTKENDLIIADYFAMLEKDIQGAEYNKTQHRRDLRKLIDRSDPSIEYKHRNISAVLKMLGEPWIDGYKPAGNYQSSLVDAVLRWLDHAPGWDSQKPIHRDVVDCLLEIGAPPLPVDQLPVREQETLIKMGRLGNKYDVAGRQARNRALGRAGEEYVLAHERASLRKHGKHRLADRVCWISEKDDSVGYDIKSFTPHGDNRRIEVKTTNGWERTPFYLTRNELAVSEKFQKEWLILRVWDFSRDPKAFELRPPLDPHKILLTPTNFLASFEV